VALQLSGITLTYVVKATIPVFTILHTSLVKGESFSTGVYMSILPTVCGVAVAAWSDSEVSTCYSHDDIYTHVVCNLALDFLVFSGAVSTNYYI
jgi:drug/metabolite transporter (DMT)-like permease